MVNDIVGPSTEVEPTDIQEEREEQYGSEHSPYDPMSFRITTNPYSLDLLLKRIKEDEIDLTPGFQRKSGLWNDEVQSRLIESLLIRIPIPTFYMDGTDENRWLVVDGLQRLTTLNKFVNEQKLSLIGLDFLKEFEGKKYDDLPRTYQRRILETQVHVYVIETHDPQVKFNVFKRINTGGLPLKSQEIRHALYQGKATKLLETLSKSSQFLKATDYGIKDDRMADQECILRFIAFYLTPYDQYVKKDLESFLNLNFSRG